MTLDKLIKESNIRYFAMQQNPQNEYLRFRYEVSLSELTSYGGIQWQ